VYTYYVSTLSHPRRREQRAQENHDGNKKLADQVEPDVQTGVRRSVHEVNQEVGKHNGGAVGGGLIRQARLRRPRF